MAIAASEPPASSPSKKDKDRSEGEAGDECRLGAVGSCPRTVGLQWPHTLPSLRMTGKNNPVRLWSLLQSENFKGFCFEDAPKAQKTEILHVLQHLR